MYSEILCGHKEKCNDVICRKMGRTGERPVSEGSYHMLHEDGKETVRRGIHYKRGIWDKRKTKIPHFPLCAESIFKQYRCIRGQDKEAEDRLFQREGGREPWGRQGEENKSKIQAHGHVCV